MFSRFFSFLMSLFRKAPPAVAAAPKPAAPSQVGHPNHAGPVIGIDLYHGNAVDDWDKLAGANAFVFLKASEGATVVDKLFHDRKILAKQKGMLVGAYHFFRPNLDAAEQAAFFLSRVGPLSEGDLPHVLDMETHGVRSAEINGALTFLSIVEEKSGLTPIIYASPFFIDELGNPAAFAKFPLWLANYGVKHPRIPKPWNTWTFWQNSETGHVPGITGNTDTDFFNGDYDALKKLTYVGKK